MGGILAVLFTALFWGTASGLVTWMITQSKQSAEIAFWLAFAIAGIVMVFVMALVSANKLKEEM